MIVVVSCWNGAVVVVFVAAATVEVVMDCNDNGGRSCRNTTLLLL